MNDLCFPQHFDHPSNPISAAFAERLTVVVAVDSLVVCLTGLTIAEWNNLKRDTKLGLPYKVDKSGE